MWSGVLMAEESYWERCPNVRGIRRGGVLMQKRVKERCPNRRSVLMTEVS